MITTTYTAPSDRIMLAAPETSSTRARRNRLVESVLRLGCGATTDPDFRPHNDHESSAAAGGPLSARVSGSGFGPRPGDPAEPVVNPTERQPPGEPSGPGSDDVALIIAGWSDHPFAMADLTSALPPPTPSSCARTVAITGG